MHSSLTSIAQEIVDFINEDDSCPIIEKQPVYNWPKDKSLAPDYIKIQQENYDRYRKFALEMIGDCIDNFIEVYTDMERQVMLTNENYNIYDIIVEYNERDEYIPTLSEICCNIVQDKITIIIDKL
jgi:hypothetical protein